MRTARHVADVAVAWIGARPILAYTMFMAMIVGGAVASSHTMAQHLDSVAAPAVSTAIAPIAQAVSGAAEGAPLIKTAVLEGDTWTRQLQSDGFWQRMRQRAAQSRMEEDRRRAEREMRFQRNGLGYPPGREFNSFGSFFRYFGGDDDEERFSRGLFRTVCVRLCDGYYFPISFATAPEMFARDAQKCEASCGTAAKLYVYRNPGQDIEQMVDLKGQPYARLKTAFLYRTSYTENCKCVPHAWETASVERHRVYALEAQRRKGSQRAADELRELKRTAAERKRAEVREREAERAARTASAREAKRRGSTPAELPPQGAAAPTVAAAAIAPKIVDRVEAGSIGAASGVLPPPSGLGAPLPAGETGDAKVKKRTPKTQTVSRPSNVTASRDDWRQRVFQTR